MDEQGLSSSHKLCPSHEEEHLQLQIKSELSRVFQEFHSELTKPLEPVTESKTWTEKPKNEAWHDHQLL